jgi:hypothetical protein
MFKKLLFTLISVGFSFLSYAQDAILNVNTPSGVIMRSQPTQKSDKIQSIPNKTQITASEPLGELETIGTVAGYWRKCTHKGKTGYVFDGYLSEAKNSDAEQNNTNNGNAYGKTKWYVVSKSGLILRTEANQTSAKLTTIPTGEAVEIGDVISSETIAGTKGNWRTCTYKGQEGFVFDGYLSNKKPAAPKTNKK